jgi:hypothetical protein
VIWVEISCWHLLQKLDKLTRNVRTFGLPAEIRIGGLYDPNCTVMLVYYR